MGFTTRGVAYNPGTNTLSGTAVHGQTVHIHINGNRKTNWTAKASWADGSWSVVLTGLASGTYAVNLSTNETSRGPAFNITKP